MPTSRGWGRGPGGGIKMNVPGVSAVRSETTIHGVVWQWLEGPLRQTDRQEEGCCIDHLDSVLWSLLQCSRGGVSCHVRRLVLSV